MFLNSKIHDPRPDPNSFTSDKVKSLLRQVKDIFDMSEAPQANEECGDCRLLERLLSVIS